MYPRKRVYLAGRGGIIDPEYHKRIVPTAEMSQYEDDNTTNECEEDIQGMRTSRHLLQVRRKLFLGAVIYKDSSELQLSTFLLPTINVFALEYHMRDLSRQLNRLDMIHDNLDRVL